jgi:hypothetical protein
MSANISAFKETGMNLGRFFLIEFGGFWVLFVSLLGNQIARHEFVSVSRRRNGFGSVEGVVLLAVAVSTGARYCLSLIRPMDHQSLPGLETGWLAAFATVCVIYLVAKGIRVLRIPRQ